MYVKCDMQLFQKISRSQYEIQTVICYVHQVDCPSVHNDLHQTYTIYSPGKQSVMYDVCAKSVRTEAEIQTKS